MPKVSTAFFLAAAICGLIGVIWGMAMGMQEDFTFATSTRI